MNTRFSALLMACLAGLVYSGTALAEPRFADREPRFMERDSTPRNDRESGRQEEREVRKARRQADKKTEEQGRERGYGYGYERRNSPRQDDDRGRR